ncbi:MAG: nucleotidyltransferase domain-containing protein [Candidatus Heimdallarchaeota archaeon]|nr:nucleotidyltransferase domain-containing protein [Candidatus Heimdallarchaeota archaeon]MBY8994874.1 nucleotidyltransferase domain-containing protein [Candidatus Heimdallarchaeota archaeon]
MPEDKKIRKKFEEALEAFIEEIKQDQTFTAALLFGSLVKGVVWEKSDIDLVLIAKDQKTPMRDFWLMDEDINLQVTVMTRNQFIRHQQRSLQGSGTHHVLTTSKVLFSEDETLNEFIGSMKKVGRRDFELEILRIVIMVIGDMEKAEKYLLVNDDVVQSYLFVNRLLDNLASIICMLNDEIPGREAVEQAMKFESELLDQIYSRVVLEKTNKDKLLEILASIRKYLEDNTSDIFRLVIEYLKQEGTFRSVTDIARFLNDKLQTTWWAIASLMLGNWLVEQGLCERVPCPVRLTLRSHEEVNEVGFYYIGDE